MSQTARHPPQHPRQGQPSASPLAARYAHVRQQTLMLAAPLGEADCQVQSMPEASPVKWHLAHVTWFFETFVLERFEADFKPFDANFRVLFNSYYQGVGEQHPRAQRGLVTRPDLARVLAYRQAVDQRIAELLATAQTGGPTAACALLIELGMQHEQQHQELILTDVLHLLSCNPLAPVYQPRWPLAAVAPLSLQWEAQAGGLVEIGHHGPGFAFDNESPRHRHWLQPYALANRPVSHGEWAQFVADGAYRSPRWWTAAGWDWVRSQRIEAPLYWRSSDSGEGHRQWHSFTLHGLVPIDSATPITHISWFEADAFARWWSAQHPGRPAARLPTEAEWEHAADALTAAQLNQGNFMESGALHPMPAASAHAGLVQLLGDVWEWTASSYLPYPGFKAAEGAVGEYNGKFMVNQMVLRGGSCATPRSHIRSSYRNFFPTDTRWQFNGLRLARDNS
ncbi:MAG: ergothioneine biosynthesis protein EgtB [Rubrivivax sp.]|nr:ergothioneine biosynthesis protein EgtB [Rubrivivax sp.]